MTYKAMDVGFVGDAYAAPMQLQSAQTLINWYLEIAESKGVKMPVAMLATPGLNPISQLASAEVRGMWVLPGGTQSIVVSGSSVYLASVAISATPSNPPTLTTALVGTLLTSSGQVVIRDNGLQFGGEGGYAVIVDGQFGYYYALPGTASVVTFTGTTTAGSAEISVSGIPNGLVVGPGTTIAGPGVPAGTFFTGADFVNQAVVMSQGATVSGSGTFAVTIPPFGRITDPGFLQASRIAFIEGWLIFNQVNSRTFFTTADRPYTLLFDATFYALKDSSTDNLVTLYENNRELWLVGERTSEVWYNAGSANFSFARVPAVGPQIGCAAQHSITRVGPQLIWLARNEQGQNMVVTGSEYSWERLSTHAIEDAINSYVTVSDAIAYGYQEDGHWFYVLTFPSANTTWCFDATTKMWHQRAAWIEGTGYIRHYSNCFMNLGNARLVGDYQNGTIYQMSRRYFTDYVTPIRRQRRTGPMWSNSDRKRVFHSWLQVEFTPGAGLPSGVPGVNPQAMLRWSNDGAYTWSNEYWRDIGMSGNTRHRCIWRRLGMARQRVYELNFIDPTPCDIIGAPLFFEMETPEDYEANG